MGYLVARAERAFRGELDQLTPRHLLSTPTYTALSVLRSRPGLSSAELARASFVRPQSMHPFVTSLEEAGFVVRQPDAANRRILRIALTPAGEAVLDACDREVADMEGHALAGLSTREIALLADLLRRIARNLERRAAGGMPDA